nr:MAG TPA: hypothetical protein [Caudoviricetes sp.]
MQLLSLSYIINLPQLIYQPSEAFAYTDVSHISIILTQS